MNLNSFYYRVHTEIEISYLIMHGLHLSFFCPPCSGVVIPELEVGTGSKDQSPP